MLGVVEYKIKQAVLLAETWFHQWFGEKLFRKISQKTYDGVLFQKTCRLLACRFTKERLYLTCLPWVMLYLWKLIWATAPEVHQMIFLNFLDFAASKESRNLLKNRHPKIVNIKILLQVDNGRNSPSLVFHRSCSGSFLKINKQSIR